MYQHNLLFPSSQPLVTSEQLWKLIWNCRGLDVDDVKFVINYDYPSNSEDYIHRYGDPMIDRSSDYGKQILDKRALGWVWLKTMGYWIGCSVLWSRNTSSEQKANNIDLKWKNKLLRIGRTGRKGNSGTAYTLFTRSNAAKVTTITTIIHCSITIIIPSTT